METIDLEAITSQRPAIGIITTITEPGVIITKEETMGTRDPETGTTPSTNNGGEVLMTEIVMIRQVAPEYFSTERRRQGITKPTGVGKSDHIDEIRREKTLT